MPDRPLAVLLLPRSLERFGLREPVEALLRWPAAVAVEPPAVSYARLGRLPVAVAAALAGMQARRMRLPGTPAVVVLFDALQYPLARALLARHRGCELWYVAGAGQAGEAHDLAKARAARVMDPAGAWPGELAAAVADLAARPAGGPPRP